MIPVQSSNLASVGYDPASAELFIRFWSGGLYRYSGVAFEVYVGLMNSPSKGSYFDYRIRYVYPTWRLV